MNQHKLITQHIQRLKDCHKCLNMAKPVITGFPATGSILLLGQAPGIKEPLFGKPFAWTAGKTMFQWFQMAWDIDEATFRQRVYIAAVCRCYPGKNPKGGDRVPNAEEIENCASWLQAEFAILRPKLVLAVGKLATQQFMPCNRLTDVVGKIVPCQKFDIKTDVIALPHPSGLSTWPRTEPGKTLLFQALDLAKNHEAFQKTFSGTQ